MTLVLAAKNENEIIVLYDTLVQKTRPRVNEPNFYHAKKARPIGDGEMFAGIAGNYGPSADTEFELIKLKVQDQPDPIKTLDDFIAGERVITMNIRYPTTYLFGLNGEDGLKLFKSYHCFRLEPEIQKPGLREVDFAGIGCGMFPDVKEMLEQGYRQGMNESDLGTFLERAMNLSKDISQKENNGTSMIRGLGIGILAADGYKNIYYAEE